MNLNEPTERMQAPKKSGEGGVETGTRMLPPLTDLQINGYAGVDFQQDNFSVLELERAVRALHRDGCGGFLATLITDDWGRMMARLARLRELREDSAILKRAILGWHIEGPFLSSEPGFCGAHDAKWMRDPEPRMIEELRRVTGSDPVLLTLAPERKGSIETIRGAVECGMVVSLGHTNAPAKMLDAAADAGAKGFTHLGNGCPQQLDRHDNILWRVLDQGRLLVSLIPDGVHVSPPFFRLAHRLTGGRVYYTTDAMSAAGGPPGLYRLGANVFEVGEDQIVRLPGRTNFAGSALRPIQAIERAAAMIGVPWPEVWRHYSSLPLELMGINAGAVEGHCGIEVGEKGTLKVVSMNLFGETVV